MATGEAVYWRVTEIYDGDVLSLWWDDASRTFHDYTSGADVSRKYTADENAAADARAEAALEANNNTTLRQQAQNALQNNRDFLALSAPTNAQVLAQVKALTRQNNGIIRLVLHDLTGTD